MAARLDRARAFPRTRTLPRAHPDEASGGRVVAVVPARNEALSLPSTLPSLMAQGPPLARILVVDDRSADDTAAVARELVGAAPPGSVPVDVVTVETLPAGWMGKVHAQAVGVEHVPPEIDWVLFTDADIDHGTGVVRRLLAQAARGPYDLVSVMARLRTDTFWERLLMPTFVYFFQAMYPFRRASDPRSPVAAAAGGCVLLRREVLARAGGPATYRAAIIDDLALARAVKGTGGRLWIGFDDAVVSRRAYPRLTDIVNMIARSAFDELGYRYGMIPLVWFGLVLLFVVPPVATIGGIATGHGAVVGLGAAGWLMATLSTAPAFRLYGLSVAWALTTPVAALIYAWATTLSALRHAFGRALHWR